MFHASVLKKYAKYKIINTNYQVKFTWESSRVRIGPY